MATHTLMIELMPPVPFTCADGTGIEKGTLLKITDANTVAASAGDADVIAGVAAAEKIANDGNTTIPVYIMGMFKATAGGNVTVGQSLMSYSSSGDANDLIDSTAAAVGSKSCGIAYETATDGETFKYLLIPGANIGALA